MAELTYRDAVAAGIAQEMRRDENVVFLGEDIGAAGGVFKATVGLFEEFGPKRVRDTPISEQAILGAAMGAAMTGLKPIAEIMFSDFLAVCWDIVANEIAKTRYMTDGQITLPLVIRTANGAGSRFGAQHSQSVENWAMMIPGIKVIAPAFPADVKGLIAAAVRDPDPVIIFEQKSLYAFKGEVPDGEHVEEIGKAKVLRNRVRSYFQSGGGHGHSPRIALMVRQVCEIEFIVTDSEAEALALESNLIKQNQPHFNVLLKDDKKYPYLCITWSEAYPRIFITRRRRFRSPDGDVVRQNRVQRLGRALA